MAERLRVHVVAFRGDSSWPMNPDENDSSVNVEGEHAAVGDKLQRKSEESHEQVAATNGLVVSHHQDEELGNEAADGKVEDSTEQKNGWHVLDKSKDAIFQGRTFLIGNLGVVVVVGKEDSADDDANDQSDDPGRDEEFVEVDFDDLRLIGLSPIFQIRWSLMTSSIHFWNVIDSFKRNGFKNFFLTESSSFLRNLRS